MSEKKEKWDSFKLRGKFLFFISLAALFSLTGCRRESTFEEGFDPRLFKEAATSWDFSLPSDYNYDPDYIQVSGNQASLRQMDMTYNSTNGFPQGTFVGTTVSNGKLTLDLADQSGVEISRAWAPKESSLIAHWSLNGTWMDSVGSHHGTNFGSAFLSSGKLGTQAADFSASGDYVLIPDQADLKPAQITASLWFKSSAPGNFKYLIGKLQDSGLGQSSYALYADGSGELTFYVTTTSGIVRSPGTADEWDDSWHHAVGTYDGSAVRLYVDGQEVDSGTASSDPIVYSTGGLNFGSFDAGSYEYNGSIDDIALWSTALSASEVASIYDRQKQKHAGSFTSAVIDIGTAANWSGFFPKTDLPFFKELPDSAVSESSSSYSSVAGDLMEDLIGLWHFNESTWSSGNPVIDSSGSGYDGYETGSANTTSQGKLDRAGYFFGNSDSVVITRSDNLISSTDQPLSISAWAYPTFIDSRALENRIISIHRGSTPGSTLVLGYGLSKKVGVYNYTDASYRYSTEDVPLREWQHLVLTYDGSCFQLYINGKADGPCEAKSLTKGGSFEARIGSYNGGSSHFSGFIDELAIWKRGLSPSEVLQLYRRGANRIKYQVRSCDDSACDTESWKGPDNTSNTYFSELQNYTSIDSGGNGSGAVQASSLHVQYTDFASAGLNISNNRYFQYRVILEADENLSCSADSCLPELASLNLEPSGRYYAGNPTISNKTGISYSDIKDISLMSSGGCTPQYQISPNGSDFYYWNGSAWMLASNTLANASLANDVQAHITDFVSSLGSGRFFFKAFLPSNLTNSCRVDSVYLQYSQ